MRETRLGSSAWGLIAGLSRRAVVRRLGVGGLAAGLALGREMEGAGAQPESTSEGAATAARQAVSAINQVLRDGDASVLDAVFAPDYVNRTPHRSLASGRLYPPDLAGLKAALLEVRALVPDAVLIVEDVIAAGDRAAIRATFRGTLDTTAAGAPRIVNPLLTVGGMAMVRVAAGLIAESWDYDEAAELFGALFAAQAAPGKTDGARDGMSSETRDVRGFQEVSLEGIGTLLIEQGDSESLTIEAEPRVLRRIETVVQAGTLIIRPARSYRTREPIIYRLSVIDLTGIEVSGAGRVEASRLVTDRLRLVVNGAGAVTIDELTAEALEAAATGNVEISLTGTVDSQTVELSGASRYRAGALASRIASITVEGAAQATVRVSESLDARVSGAGSLEYIGDPAVSQDVSGVGSVTKIG